MGKPISTLHVMIAALAVLLLTVCGNVFAAQSTADAVADVATKEKLRKDSLEECRRVLGDLVSSPVIEQVLFTGFVMQ